MALSKPILAVVALGAFTAAYGNFMFAFLLCPDERMWTLMVFLYQLQINGHTALTFAALLVAAVPTLVAFLACQRLIMRGIVVPVEK
jgi:multiple sugar transport system permease protein